MAEEWGVWNVRKLADDMDMRQFQEWVAYYEWKRDREREQMLEAKADANRQKAEGLIRG